MFIYRFCTVYKQTKRNQWTSTNHNCFYRSRASRNRPRTRTRSNRSRKPAPIFGVENLSRFRMTHVPKVGFRPRVSSALNPARESGERCTIIIRGPVSIVWLCFCPLPPSGRFVKQEQWGRWRAKQKLVSGSKHQGASSTVRGTCIWLNMQIPVQVWPENGSQCCL